MALTRSRPTCIASARGFSLVELSIVVAIISVVATLGLEVAANFVNRTSTSVSRERLKLVDDTTANFFRLYGRLPCPADKTLAPSNTNYGLENCGLSVLTGTTVGGGLLSGAVPYRTLNLPVSYSLDGFGSKFNYVVTKNLTQAGRLLTGQFGYNSGTAAQNGIAGIEVRTGQLAQPCNASNCQVLADPSLNTGAAYVIFSSGPDQRGARSERGTALKNCTIYNPERRVDAQNCVFGAASMTPPLSVTTIPKNVFYDNRYNAGFNLTSYYDDALVWRPRARL